MQADFSPGQTTHLQQFQGHNLIAERLNSGSFSNFQISYSTPRYENEYAKHRPASAEIWLLMPDAGVVVFNYKTKKIRSFYSNRPDNQLGNALMLSALHIDTNGLVWLADDTNNRLITLNPESGEQQAYLVPSAPVAEAVSVIEADHKGNIWINRGGDGIYCFDRSQRKWTVHIQHDPLDMSSLAANAVSELLIDKEGVLWANPDPTGLDKIIPDPAPVRHYDVDPIRAPSLGARNVWKLLEDRQGLIWIGLYAGGIDVFDPRTERIVRHYSHTSQPNSLPNNTIYAMHIDRSGRIWVGAGTTFCRYEPMSDSFRPVRPTRSDSLAGDHRVVGLLERPDGRFFVATWGGLYQFDPDRNRLDLLAGAGVRFTNALYYDHRRKWLLAAPRHKGLICYDVQAGNRLRPRYTAIRQLSVQDITPDHDSSRVWLSTTHGLYLMRVQDGKILRIWNEKDGLPRHVTYSALADRSGQRWVSTNRGIVVLEPRSGRVRHVRSIEPTEFNFAAFLLTRSGEMYFGSTTGLYRFDPIRQTARSHALSVNFTRLLINDQTVQPDSGLTVIKQISLSASQRTLTLQFGAIDYFSDGQNQYRYRLNGYDPDWVESGSVGTVRYANLPPGQYVFEVIAADADGRWMTVPRRLTVIVTPPFWRTGWFVLLLLLVLVALLYAGLRFYLRERLRRQRREFQLQAVSQQNERERLARDLHDHVGPDLVALKLQLEATREDVPGSAVEPVLSRLIEQAEHIIVDLRRVSHALMPVRLQEQGLVANLTDFVGQLNALGTGPEISFTYQLGSLLSESHRHRLLQIAKELIHNAIRHASATLIDVELYETEQSVQLTISDNGKGYDPMSPAYSGIGLRNVRSVTRQLHGELTILAKETGGMMHRVSVPLH